MIDIVFPDGDENEFIRIAERLGFEGLVFVYRSLKDLSSFQKETKLKLSSAVFCRPEDVRKFKGRALTLVECPDDQNALRQVIEGFRPDILFDLEFSGRKDFIHHRASGLNHVLSQLAADKGVAIGFDFSALLALSPKDRAVCIGRMSQNIMFARKFRFDTVIASFARSPWQMRSARELVSFFVTLGMAEPDARKALGWRSGHEDD